MRNTFKILPVLTGDVSGAASALYELGGMTVIHDPSGCNSTYNTHDETRWYNEDSLIYISGLNDMDAITGNDDRFINAILDAADALSPRFIALANSPIPFLNGTDFDGIAKVITGRTGIPCFYVSTNATGDYASGASKAFEAYVRQMTSGIDKKISNKTGKIRAGIIGATPLDFANPETIASVVSMLESNGFEVLYSLAMGDLSEGAVSGNLVSTDVNLVISSTGLACAKYLYESFCIPYVAGFPAEGFADTVFREMRNVFETSKPCVSYEEINRNGTDIMIAGELVTASSIAAGIKETYDIDLRVVSVSDSSLLAPSGNDLYCHREDDFIDAFKDAKTVIADPLYKHVCPENTKFIELPHLAMSGRLYLKKIPDITGFDPIKEGLL